MKLRQLFEAKTSEVAIIFGRFNPPHKGHRAAWELASKSPVWYVGTNQSTVGPKDPLPYDIKVEAMKTIWPEVEGHIVAETSWLTLASKVYEQYPDATLLCLTDEDWVTKTIQQYNGKEGAHGFYNFKNITQKPTPRLSSATALRDAVSKGDRDAFSQAAGVSADTKVAGKPFFDLVAEYLLPYQNAPKKVAKKKKEPAVAEDSIDQRIAYAKKNNPLQASVRQHEYGYTALVTDANTGKPSWFGGAVWQTPELAMGHAKAFVKGFPYLEQRFAQRFVDKNFDGIADQGVAEAEKNPHTSALGKALYRDLSKEKKASPQQVQRNKERWAQRQADREQGVAEGWKQNIAAVVIAAVAPMVAAKQPDQQIEPTNREAIAKVIKMANLIYNAKNISQAGAQEELQRELKRWIDRQAGLTDQPTRLPLPDIKRDNAQSEDAAGVGIITKQNTTKDVNKGTLRKMMKGFKLI